MRFLAAFTVFALGVVAVSATEPETTVARLIADAWQPQEVRVEWQFTGPTPKAVADYEDWAIAEPRPTRLAGSLIVVLERSAGQDQKMRLPVSGTARVYGPSLMPTHTVHIGEPVDSSKVTLVESEWTRLKGNAAQWENLSGAVIAARTLVPGRSIVVTDLKP
ncbi:hypothetical protein KKH27_11840, partial [bacterium]|nr:hypothetical protein [bacterium]